MSAWIGHRTPLTPHSPFDQDSRNRRCEAQVVTMMARLVVFLPALLCLLCLANSTLLPEQVRNLGLPECPAEGTVNFPDPESCSGYYVCTAGDPIHFDCPAGTMWNQELGLCDLPENVECSIELSTTTERLEPECPEVEGVFFLPHSANCSLYWVCYDQGQAFSLDSCAQGLLFDPILLRCSRAEDVECGWSPSSPSTPSQDFSCPSDIEFIYMPHPDLCTMFYWCRDGQYDGMSGCGQGLWFSFLLQACVPPYESDCDKEPRPSTSTTASSDDY